ncbi:MAG TPA: hypothetical protein ENK12_12525 [Gammaproteobacteria bacterium]|nr:hypothetical protein [Gammaproteobacteria bacterium]
MTAPPRFDRTTPVGAGLPANPAQPGYRVRWPPWFAGKPAPTENPAWPGHRVGGRRVTGRARGASG